MEKTSEVLNGCMEKIKVSSAEIVVHGIKDKPYYEIKYRDLSDGQIHEGYSSYNLDYVFEWLEECFEIIPEKDADRMSVSEQVKELRDLSEIPDIDVTGLYNLNDILAQTADTIEALSAKLADMERSVEDCGGGWIPCDKDNLPDKEVLCCDQCGEMILGYVSEDKTSYTGFCAENDNVYMYNCVKWMEKPKP